MSVLAHSFIHSTNISLPPGREVSGLVQGQGHSSEQDPVPANVGGGGKGHRW